MVLVEYRAKHVLASAGIAVPSAILVDLDNDAAIQIGSLHLPVMVKAQVPAGRRAKRGGVLAAHTYDEVSVGLHTMRDLSIDGYPVRQVLLEEFVGDHQSFYLSLSLDRNLGKFVLMASPYGGVDIEEVASTIKQWPLTYSVEIPEYVKRQVTTHLGLTGADVHNFRQQLDRLYAAVHQWHMLLVEINPLALLPDGRLIALDAKMMLDDKAAALIPDQMDTRKLQTPFQQAIAELGIAGVDMTQGNIAVITSGAGVGMATMDCVNVLGGTVSAFVDLGGIGIRESHTVRGAIQVLQQLVKPDVYLFNFFFQLADSKILAEAIAEIFRSQDIQPVARFRGHHEERACATVASISQYVTTDFMQACQWAVQLAEGLHHAHPAQ